jgi:hypothetical protein
MIDLRSAETLLTLRDRASRYDREESSEKVTEISPEGEL